MIISIHIPKNAGNSFKFALEKVYVNNIFFDYLDKIASKEYLKNKKPTYSKIKKNIQIIHGHFQAEKYLKKYPNAKFITWLRHPIERLASHYHFWRRSPDPHNSTCTEMIDGNYSFLEFAKMPQMLNLQSFYIYPLKPENFSFIGLTSYYEVCINILNKILGQDMNLPFTKRNKNPQQSSAKYHIRRKIRKEIENIHQKDMELYEMVEKAFIKKHKI